MRVVHPGGRGWGASGTSGAPPSYGVEFRSRRRNLKYGYQVTLTANVTVAIVAAIHVYILVLEMFLWTSPRGRKAFGTDPEFARATATLAANQGLYNGFLAAGLVWALLATGATAFQAKIFFLGCVIVAGVYGAATASRRILLVQALPAAIALALVLTARWR